MLSSAGRWRLAPDALARVRSDGAIGRAVHVSGSAGSDPIMADGWIIGWLNAAGFPCSREDSVALRVQVFSSTARSVIGKTILVSIGTPPSPMRN